MKVLLPGARGMVARSVAAYCSSIGDEVLALSRKEMDIADRDAVTSTVRAFRPDAIINCAAYTNVDKAETEKEQAFRANVTGPENLALAARSIGCGLVTVSTDYVFDGAWNGFYDQRHTPRPLSVYGETKRLGEIAASSAFARTIVVRTGWIFGKGGSNFLSQIPRLLAEGRNITAICDAFGTPTFAGDLARRLRELAELDLPAVFHVTNAGAGASYLEFADRVRELGGFDRRLIEGVSMSDLPRPAPRPANSKLACLFSERFGLAPLPDWREALERFVTDSL